MEELLTINFIVSFIVSIATAGWFIYKQYGFYRTTMDNLDLFKNFFNKRGKYDTYDVSDGGQYGTANKMVANKRLTNIAIDSSEFYSLISDINEYLASCRGTATFSIIQNKTERRITKLYDQAASKSSFPTHYGLMGTFVGVFLGLFAFLVTSLTSDDGITDVAIHSLIMGVLVSMSTSFIGLILSTSANDKLSDAKNKIDVDKNEFYEFVQNKLMPSVDINLTEALGKLHDTVTTFEPSFSKVIKGFNDTFKECTKAFGDDFKDSVKTMVSAVDKMSTNINAITSNVSILENLLNRLSGAQWMAYMRQFAEATEHFKTMTQSLNDFERARRMMLAAAQEAINIQKTYNDSLQLPRDVATHINSILQRVVTFEENINRMGVDIAHTQMIGNKTIEEIQAQIEAIKTKHKVAKQYMETSNEKLEKYFQGNLLDLKALEEKYRETLANLFDEYNKVLEDHKNEIDKRHEIFKTAIDEKFELSGVRDELSNLKKLPGIEAKVDDVKKIQEKLQTGQDKLQKTNEGIRNEINAVNAALEDKEKGLIGRITGSNTAKDRKIEQQQQENEELLRRLEEQARKEKEDERKFQELMAHRELGSANSSSASSTPNVGASTKPIEVAPAHYENKPSVEEPDTEESKSIFGLIKSFLSK